MTQDTTAAAPGGAALLAQLLRQGEGDGADIATLRAIAEEAGELAATRALARLGLADADAVGDVRELRELLRAWRDAKRSAWRALWGWIGALASSLLLAAMAVRHGWVR